MKKVGCEFLVLLTLLGIVGLMTPAVGQEVTAGIVGTVTDPSGAPINGAAVTARDTERGTVWTATTSDAGAYNITRLPVGTYEVKVAAPGFQTAVHPPFVLVLNQTARVDVQMKVGNVSETLEVTGEAPILQTQSTEVSTLIDSNTTVSMPLASRNYLQLTLLAPGVTNVDPDGMRQPQSMLDSGRPYINGNREQANEYLLDGQLNSEDKNNETGYTPSIDAVQEFNLITQNASAEFGNYEGGVVSATIKSGTNNFHGDVYEFWRTDKLDANIASAGWTEGLPGQGGVLGHSANGTALKSELRYNQFGATFGGPIIRDKLFFFADYQGQRFLTSAPTGAQLLTASARAGDFGQLCTSFGGSFNGSGICSGGTGINITDPNNANAVIPFNKMSNASAATNTISPFAQNLFSSKYYPLPQIDSLNGNNDFFQSGHQLNNDQGDLKIDYVPSQKDRIFGRWSQMDLKQVPTTGLLFAAVGDGGLIRGGSDEPVRNVVVDWTHSFGGSLLNDFRIGFNAVKFTQSQTPTTSLGNISEQLGIAGANAQGPGLLFINVAGSGIGANAGLGQQNLVQIFHDTQGQAEDNIILTRGRHQIKTGFQYVRERQNYIYPGNNGVLGLLNISALTGSGLADLWMGNVGGASFRDTGGADTLDQLRGNVYGAYVQDDWRITNTLTLNLGLRFEDHTPLSEVHNRVVNFGLYTGTIYTPTGIDGTTKFGNPALYNNYLGIGDFLPRFGFAWSPAIWEGKTVIRGGFGVSQYVEGGGGNEELTQNLPYGIVQSTYPAGMGTITQGFPAAPNCTSFTLVPCYGGQRIRIFDQNFKPAMNYQWNFTIQQQLTKTLTMQIGYVGQHGVHLLNFEDVAQRVGLNAQGGIAQPGQLIVSQRAGPFLGGGSVPCAQTPGAQCGVPGSLYSLDQTPVNAAGNFACCGSLAGTNMSNADQKYDALQAVLQKRMGDGLQAQIAYTWGKCMSNSPGFYGTGWGSTNAQSSGGQPGWENIYNPRAEWGPCYFDQTQILSSYVTYALPIGKGKRFGHDMNPVLNAVVGNWEIGGIVSFHTGNALTLNEFGGWGIGGDTSHTGGIEPFTLSGRPNCNGPIQVVDKKVPANPATGTPAYIQWFDTSNITDPAPYTFGTCGVGNVRGPHYSDVDLSLHKDFLVTESKRLEFRFEALNAFNHPVWTFSGGPAPNGSFNTGSSVFGQITGSQGARQLQLAMKFYF
jgi:hypothetical protein